MRKFLVVYSYLSKYGLGYGNIDFTCNYDVPTMKNIREMERQIREKFYFDNVVILNIIELNNEESEDTE